MYVGLFLPVFSIYNFLTNPFINLYFYSTCSSYIYVYDPYLFFILFYVD